MHNLGGRLEVIELVSPELVQECPQGGETLGVDPVQTAVRVDTDMHQTRILQPPQMLARRRSGLARGLRKLRRAALGIPRQAQHRPTAPMADRLQRILHHL